MLQNLLQLCFWFHGLFFNTSILHNWTFFFYEFNIVCVWGAVRDGFWCYTSLKHGKSSYFRKIIHESLTTSSFDIWLQRFCPYLVRIFPLLPSPELGTVLYLHISKQENNTHKWLIVFEMSFTISPTTSVSFHSPHFRLFLHVGARLRNPRTLPIGCSE